MQHSFSKQVTTAQSKCITFFQKSFIIPDFCKYILVHIYKTTSSDEVNLRAERIVNSRGQFILCFDETISAILLNGKENSL